ncbi:hypothetical protein PWG14_26325 [Chromobacterium amazonense]|uniref:hypothetical protein n=1 Tax=Chromobacterium amazonense TaxID=1382803 RepID=UPI00237E4967|nr:hypothetical protein [Chromobacterium amazonense]MDE1715985.1 hypothetical protein [Chromobacterium amazonense]
MLTPDQLAILRTSLNVIAADNGITPRTTKLAMRLLAHIDAQAKRIAELERDATRYRALREAIITVDPSGHRGTIETAIKELIQRVHFERATMEPTNDEFDAAIDAAMEQQCQPCQP